MYVTPLNIAILFQYTMCNASKYDPKNIGKAKETGECENDFRGFD